MTRKLQEMDVEPKPYAGNPRGVRQRNGEGRYRPLALDRPRRGYGPDRADCPRDVDHTYAYLPVVIAMETAIRLHEGYKSSHLKRGPFSKVLVCVRNPQNWGGIGPLAPVPGRLAGIMAHFRLHILRVIAGINN